MDKIKELWNKIFRRKAAEVQEGEAEESAAPKEKKKAPLWWVITRKVLWGLVLTMMLTGFFVVIAFGWFAFVYVDDEFDLSLVDSSLEYTSVVYAMKDGKPVEAETLHSNENRKWVDIEDVPDQLRWAFIAIEDERFYEHSGVDVKRTLAAVLNFFNPSSGSTFGGSTITQQVIKNLTGDDEQTVTRKVQEIRRAWYLEREYTKDQILEVYLNTIYLSQGCYGVQTAAEVYFGKNLDELSLLECASIASITKYPSLYDPVANPEKNEERARLVINKMLELGKITEEEHKAAKDEKLALFKGEMKVEEGAEVNSYFVDQVILDAIDALVNEKGYSESYAYKLLYSEGVQIYSTMDMDVQKVVTEYYNDPENFPKITSKYGESPQSAMVIIDNETGAIVAMAGGIGEKKTALGLNRATQSYFQPGSCMKPIGTYAPAIEYEVEIDGARVAPGLMVQDMGVRKNSKGNWWPKNYNGPGTEKYMTVQQAVARSTNTVAVRVNNALGASVAFNFLQNNLGITTLKPGSNHDENDQAMALGGLTKGISVKEITAAYAAFPNEGTYIKPYTFTKICDQNGRVILENHIQSNTAMEKSTAGVMNSMLKNAAEVGTGTVARFRGADIGGKTGTTDDDKDRWFVGYTGYYTAAVWFGYDKPATVYWSGNNPAAVTWKRVMQVVHEDLPYKSLYTTTAGMASYTCCVESGKLATELCEETVSGNCYAVSPPAAPCDVCGVVEGEPGELPGNGEGEQTPGVDTPIVPKPDDPVDDPSDKPNIDPIVPEPEPEKPGEGEGEGEGEDSSTE
ncbi:MAG: PBP1A family penicillin-binding protein [Clostridia bacterium]|nr:PBP1A family penicillin-binding protein [Clostridia bacterium]